ncbi:MAG TPA: helix-turn-helix domain-containing protein [Thermotogota bacterium]|nr:helix-turn-helix domain-containing protein [Thermotogota bacterium]HPR96894.1 helix-turn-helix domain-containing protein [Thermotogota bacterium]
MNKKIMNTATVINYVEDHLMDKLSVEKVALAVHYSKYHLHRVFTETVGVTIHDYIRRRQLTEAARQLVFSDKPIIEIALFAGYESQQAFTTVFKAMYKQSPRQYRETEVFYPLQLRCVLSEAPSKRDSNMNWENKIIFSNDDDIQCWMDLVHLVIDGFPYLIENEYVEKLKAYIRKRCALMIKDGDMAVGIMAVDDITGMIDFLGIHPQYRGKGIFRAFLQNTFSELIPDTSSICMTTFREGDKADPGYRKVLKKNGFTEAELLVEFGYPTQKFIFRRENLEVNFDGTDRF